MRGALLVANQYVVNGKLAQRVVGGQDGAAGIAEDVGDAFAHQRGPQNLSAGEARGRGQVSACVRYLSVRVCFGPHVNSLLAASF